jgi:hypothetical protein
MTISVSASPSPRVYFKDSQSRENLTTKHENRTPPTPLHPHTPTPFFKLAVHERLYTTKHENFSLRVPASPSPRVYFQDRSSAVTLAASFCNLFSFLSIDIFSKLLGVRLCDTQALISSQ